MQPDHVFSLIQDHVEGYHELSAKTKIFFATAISLWDAEFYVKVDDDVHVNLGLLLDFNYWRLFLLLHSWLTKIAEIFRTCCRYACCNTRSSQIKAQDLRWVYEVWPSSFSEVSIQLLFIEIGYI